jgi:hypothetical protein
MMHDSIEAHVTQLSVSSDELRQPKRAHTRGESFAGLPNHVWIEM